MYYSIARWFAILLSYLGGFWMIHSTELHNYTKTEGYFIVFVAVTIAQFVIVPVVARIGRK